MFLMPFYPLLDHFGIVHQNDHEIGLSSREIFMLNLAVKIDITISGYYNNKERIK